MLPHTTYKKSFVSSFENLFSAPEIEVEQKDFIGIYHKALDKKYCAKLIDIFETDQNKHELIDSMRRDSSIDLNFTEHKDLSIVKSLLSLCFEDYIKNFYFLRNYSMSNTRVKLQKTVPFGGFHKWHFEHATASPERTVVWMIYLNDLPSEEGTTEFLYQCLKSVPEEGTVLFWPAAYTHVHRGNPPFTTDKYIATGWYNFCSPDNPFREKCLD